jgi:hypothetical protein
MIKLIPVGLMMALASNTIAQTYSDRSDGRISVEVNAGFVGDYDDSNLWHSGYTAGVGGLWWASESVHLGACFAITHWSYRPDDTVAALVPDDAVLMVAQSSGQIEMLELIPSLRWERNEVLPHRCGVLVQGGVGAAYVKTFALTEVLFETATANPEVARFEINESTVRVVVAAVAGLTRPISTSAWLEVFPSYRAVFMDEVTHVFAISIGCRVQV